MKVDVPIALDRASVRRIDQDGHLFIEVANISAACVSPYNATEIPDWQRLGLKEGEVYNLLRDPVALEESAKSFAGKPLLFLHRAVSADDHPHEIVVGAIGNDVRFEDPFLKASLSIWDKEAIDAVENGSQSDLSCGYYYECVMEPGVYKGNPHQGSMLSIKGNHCALVTDGRVPGAFVGDSALPLITIPDPVPPPIPETTPAPTPEPTPVTPSKPQEINTMASRHAATSAMASVAKGAIYAYLRPKLIAADTQIDLVPVVKGVTIRNWKASKPKIKAALDTAIQGKLAQDADISDIIDMLDQLEDMSDEDVTANTETETAEDAEPDPDDDDEEAKKKKAKEAAEKLKEAAADADKDDDDDDKKKSASDADKDDDDDDDKKKPAFLKDRRGAKDKAKAMDAEPRISKAAMDAAISSAVKSATREAERNTIARLRSIATAEKAVRPYIGDLAQAMDSAEAVYKMALDSAGVDLDGVPPAAFAAMVKMLPTPGETKTVKARVAMDSAAAVTARSERFPNANRLQGR